MPRFTPWYADPLPEPSEPCAFIEAAIRPGLLRAFPLPPGGGADARFRSLLDALAQVGTPART